MKKLKCESCGGDIEIKENENIAVCPFCKTKYQLNEKKEILIKVDEDIKKMTMDVFERQKKASKILVPFVVVFFLITFGVLIFNIYKSSTGTSKVDISSYNGKVEIYKGTRDKSSVGRLIDNIVTINKTDKHKITVVFGKVNTSDPNEIVKIKKELKDWTEAEYEVTIDYDKQGFANKVTIEEVQSKAQAYKDKYDEVTGNMTGEDESFMDDFDEQFEKAGEVIEKGKEAIEGNN